MDVLPGKYKLTEDSRSSMFKDVSLNDVFFFFWFSLFIQCGVFRPLDGWICLRTSMVCKYIIFYHNMYLQYILYTASMRI